MNSSSTVESEGKRRWAALLLACFAFSQLITPASAAQYNTAEISGTVKDAQGGVVRGATVTAVHVASGLNVVRISDDGGRFFLPALPWRTRPSCLCHAVHHGLNPAVLDTNTVQKHPRSILSDGPMILLTPPHPGAFTTAGRQGPRYASPGSPPDVGLGELNSGYGEFT
jgi:hypothetical protein